MRFFKKAAAVAASIALCAQAWLPASLFAQQPDPVSCELTAEASGNGAYGIEIDGVTNTISEKTPYKESFPAGTLVNVSLSENDDPSSVLLNDEDILGSFQNRKYSFYVTDPKEHLLINFGSEPQIQTETATIQTKQKTASNSSKNDPKSIKDRKAKAAELGISDCIDENGYLTKKFFITHDPLLTNLPEYGMLRSDDPVYLSAKDYDLIEATPYYSVRIRNLEYLRAYMPGGGYIDNGIWTLTNNATAFCGNGLLAPPQIDTSPTSNPQDIGYGTQAADQIRKVLFYGYGGPDNRLTSLNRNQQIILTNEMLSNAACGTCISRVVDNGLIWTRDVEGWYNNIQRLAPPRKEYKVYRINFANSSKPSWQNPNNFTSQPLFYGVMEETPAVGSVYLRKTSTDPALTSNNPNYSLEGAHYTLTGGPGGPYDFWTDANGHADKDNVVAGTYKLTEVASPKGFSLNIGSQTVTVPKGGSVTINSGIMRDSPKPSYARFYIEKESPVSWLNNSYYSLAGARYGVYANLSDAQAGNSRYKEVLVTGSDGETGYSDQYDVSKGTVTLYVREIRAPSGYDINTAVYKINLTSDMQGKNVQYTFEDEPQVGQIHLLKKDKDTGANLAGAEFTLYNATGKPCWHDKNHNGSYDSGERIANGAVVDTGTTNSDGLLIFHGLSFGQYQLVETQAPTGYEGDPARFTVTVDSSTAPAQVTRTNTATKPGAKVTINKQDEFKANLPGAVFTIYSDQALSQQVATGTTDSQGIVNFGNLDFDKTYYIKETKAPDGYVLPNPNNPITLNVSSATPPVVTIDGKTADPSQVQTDARGNVTVTIIRTDKEAEKEYSLTLNKQDENQKKLPGAEFALYKDEAMTQQVATGTTDNNGVVNFGKLETGQTYYLVETKAPDGYILPSPSEPTSILVKYSNKKYTVLIDGNESTNFTTDAQGNVTVTITRTNYEQPKTFGVKLNKQDQNKQALPGAEFVLYLDPDLTQQKATGTTDANGVVNFGDLDVGTTYYIKETKAPFGYELPAVNPAVSVLVDYVNKNYVVQVDGKDTKDYTIDDQGNLTVTISKDNQAKPFQITLNKQDENKKPLAGAVFNLYSDESLSTQVGTGTTDENGVVNFGTLQIGQTYYLKEVQAPDGYMLPDDNPAVSIKADLAANNTYSVQVDGKESTDFTVDNDGNLTVTITKVNKATPLLPDTGVNWTLILLGTAAIAIVFGLSRRFKFHFH